MKLKIEIEMSNSAFEECSRTEVGNILKKYILGDTQEGMPFKIGEMVTLKDTNGNNVGVLYVTR